MMTLVDYGVGNIQAFETIYKKLNVPVRVAKTVNELAGATKLILPGVGSFDWAISRLNNSGMRLSLDDLVLKRKCPVLGICVGMQMMANSSEEGDLRGLGWIDGEVKHFDFASYAHKIDLPHMGWNDVLPGEVNTLFSGLEVSQFYFLHSYYFAPNNLNNILASTNYGSLFASSVRLDNIFGVQFHPEKSHQWGIRLLKNFSEL
jgi:glutamine amidotransferase